MTDGNVDLNVAMDDAVQRVQDTQNATEDAAEQMVEQLTVLAEGAMKDEAPTGGGRGVHMRDTVTTTFEDDGKTGRVWPTKETSDGDLLASIVTGNPGPWTSKPPADPLLDWADAKLGDPGIGWYLRDQIYQHGIQSFPDDFIDRSVDRWLGDVQDVAGAEVSAAFARAGAVR